jgi:hypothetical protein
MVVALILLGYLFSSVGSLSEQNYFCGIFQRSGHQGSATLTSGLSAAGKMTFFINIKNPFLITRNLRVIKKL